MIFYFQREMDLCTLANGTGNQVFKRRAHQKEIERCRKTGLFFYLDQLLISGRPNIPSVCGKVKHYNQHGNNTAHKRHYPP